MGTLALYMLVSSVIQNCYLRSSQCNAELDGEVNPWGERVGNTPASVTSLLQLRRASARGEGLSAKVPLVKASEAVHTEGTSSPARPGPGPGSEAFFSSSSPRRALPTEEASGLLLPLEGEQERAGEESGTAAPAGSSAQGPPGVTEPPSGMWGKETPARSRNKMYSLPSGNGTGMLLLFTQRKQENATRPPITTARRKPPSDSQWLPGLEKHDIPVVVGVSGSLALIFISMGVYSFRQKTENAKGKSTASPKSSQSRRRRNYLEVDGTYENRAFQVECAVDAVEQNPYETSTSPSLLDSGLMLPAQAVGHQKEPPGVAAGKALQTAQPRAVDSPGSMQHESARQERHPSPHRAAPSAAPVLSKSASAWTPGTGSATSPALQRVGATLYFHGPEPLLWSMVPLGRNAGGHCSQVTAGPAPAGGVEECSPPREQSSSGTAMLSVTVDIHLYPCTPEISSAPAAAQTVSDSSHPEAAGAASQQPASLLGPGPRSFL